MYRGETRIVKVKKGPLILELIFELYQSFAFLLPIFTYYTSHKLAKQRPFSTDSQPNMFIGCLQNFGWSQPERSYEKGSYKKKKKKKKKEKVYTDFMVIGFSVSYAPIALIERIPILSPM